MSEWKGKTDRPNCLEKSGGFSLSRTGPVFKRGGADKPCVLESEPVPGETDSVKQAMDLFL